MGAIGGEPTRIRNVRAPIVWRHEESILIVTGVGVGAVLRLAAALEGLNDDHAATTARARTWQDVLLIGRCGLGVSGSFKRDGAASNWRARSMLAARSALANSP